MIRLGKSRRDLAMVGVSAFAIVAMSAGAAAAQTALSEQKPATDSAAPTVKEVVVTGQRASLRSAQQIKRNAEQIVDSITATDIGALPDRSVTESLQRIAGVTITRTSDPRDADRLSVEGAGVQVDGLSYVRSEMDGRDSFSAKNGRALSFDDIPPELMAGVDVYKNPSADMIEGQIGGTIDLRTRLPFDQPGHLVAFSADANYGTLINKWTPSGSVLASDRWQTPAGEVGLLVDFSDSNFSSRTDTLSVNPYAARTDLVAGKTVYVPGGFGWRRLDFNRERQGVAAAAQWRPSDQLLVTAQFIRSASYSDENENAIGDDSNIYPAAGTNFTFDNAGKFVSGSFVNSAGGTSTAVDLLDDRYNTTHSVTSDYSLNLKWTPTSRWALSADVQYINSSTKATDFTVFNAPMPGNTFGPGTMNLSGGVPYMNLPSSPGALDKSAYYWDAAMDYHNRNNGDEWAERADATYTFDSDWLKTFRFGVRHTEKDVVTRETNYNWSEVTYSWAGGGLALLNGTNSQYPGATNSIPSRPTAFGNFFSGGAHLPGVFLAGAPGFLNHWSPAVAAIIQAENRSGGNCCGWSPGGNFNEIPGPNTSGGQPVGVNTEGEETWAGYGLLRFGHDLPIMGRDVPMDGNIGLRVVSTDASGTGNGVFSSPGAPPTTGNDPYAGTPAYQFLNNATFMNRGGRNYISVLPSLNVRFKPTPTFFVRFAASKDMVRPSFAQMQPGVSIFAQGGILQGGNCVINPSGSANTCLYGYGGYAGSPELKPIRGDTYHLSFEWYFAKVGSLTATMFYKDIYDFISTTTVSTKFSNNGYTENVNLTTPYNAGHGTIKGFELAYQQYFDFLPGVLKGIGAQANYTYLDSHGAVNAPESPYDSGQIANSKLNLPLEGLSRTSYNLAALYDYGPVSLRLAYNWREKYLLTTDAANINLPAWTDDYGQLDASGFYTINKYLKVGVQAANITGSTYKVSVSYISNPLMTGHNWVDSDRRISLVLRGQF